MESKAHIGHLSNIKHLNRLFKNSSLILLFFNFYHLFIKPNILREIHMRGVSFVVDLMLWKGKVFEILNNNNVKVLSFNALNKFY